MSLANYMLLWTYYTMAHVIAQILKWLFVITICENEGSEIFKSYAYQKSTVSRNWKFLYSNIDLQVITQRTEVKWLSVPVRKINSLLFKYQIEQPINEIGNRSSELFQLEIVTTFLFKYKTGPPYYSIRNYENQFSNAKSTSLLFLCEKVPVYYSNTKTYQSIIAKRTSTSLLFQYEKVPVFYSNTKQ